LITIAALNLTGGSTPQRMYAALQLEMIAHTLIASAGMYLFMRILVRWRIPALIAAVTYAYGGFYTGYPQLQLAIIEAGAWLPFALVALSSGFISPPNPFFPPKEWEKEPSQDWLGTVIAGVFLGLSLLAGHPQTTLFFIYVCAVYLAWQVFDKRESIRVWIVNTAIFGAVGGGIAAVQLLPGLEYLRLTARPQLNFEALGNGFPFYDVAQLVFPGILSLWSPLYFGVVGLFLAISALTKKWWNPRPIIYWMLLGVGALALSFGARTVFFDLLYNVVPGFTLFRGQERAAYVIALCAAVLVGYGAVGTVSLWADRPHSGKLLGRFAGVIALVAGGLFILKLDGSQNDAVLNIAAFSTLIAFVAAWLIPAKLSRWKPAALLVLVVFELFTFGRTNPNWEPIPVSERLPMPFGAAEILQRQAGNDWRTAGVPENFGSLFGVREITGISPLKLARIDAVLKMPNTARVWDVFAVSYVLTPNEELPVPSTIILRDDNPTNPVKLHEITNPRPFARMVYRTWVEPNDQAAYGILSEPAFDAANTVIVPEPIELQEGSGSVRVVVNEPEYMRFEGETSTAGLVNIALPYYPGWVATLNGQPAEIVRADVAMSAVLVGSTDPAGAFTLELRYDPLSYRIGVIITLVTIIGVLLVTGFTVSNRRKPAPDDAAGGDTRRG
jgi:hypothetical protein